MKQFSDKLQPLLKEFDCVIGFNRMPGLTVFFAGESCYVAGIAKKKSKWFKLTSRYKIYKKLEEGVYGEGCQTQALLLSPSEQELILTYYPHAKNRLHLLPPGIEKNRMAIINREFVRESLRKQLGVQTFMLLMVGSDFRRKGVDRSIYAMASLPEELKRQVQLVVVGKGDSTSYQRLAKKLRVDAHVQFLGAQEDVPSYLLAADVLLHPAKEETAGMVLVEAMASSLPIIVTQTCGYAYLVAAAQAGKVLPEPFEQQDFNGQLKKMLSAPLSVYKDNMVRYQRQHDLFGLEKAVVNFIEHKCRLR